MREHIVAVDVGTGSARAGVFTRMGEQLARCAFPIVLNNPKPGHFEQDSEDIWRAVCRAVRAALGDAGVKADEVAAIGFDATCSLVLRSREGAPLTVSTSGAHNFDTMLWMDHRAIEETEECNATGDPLLDQFGGRLSAEMQAPKLMWLKRNLPSTWEKAGLILDLSEYLTWRATGLPGRSHSPLAAKWGFGPEAPGRRPTEFYRSVGLEDAFDKGALPDETTDPGQPIGQLSPVGAAELGLTTACLVAQGLIDAYAGAAGIYHGAGILSGEDLEDTVAVIAGTSSCIIYLSEEQVQFSGCWGGFKDVGAHGHWLLEAGQSASGALLDHILRTHPAGGEPGADLHLKVLDHIAVQLRDKGHGYGLPLMVLPDFHGTRSPVSDVRLTGTIYGLTLERDFDSLCKLYWRACVGLAAGIRHIMAHMPQPAREASTILLAGGFAYHRLIPELYANMTGCMVKTLAGRDAVLSGTALNAARIAGLLQGKPEELSAFRSNMQTVKPDETLRQRFDADYQALLTMIRHREEMNPFSAVSKSPSGLNH
jgi:FGGY-family pentulose kinase